MTFKLPEGRTIRVLFHACGVQKPILYLGCLAQQDWSDLRADTGTLFFPDGTRSNAGAQGREFILCQRDDSCALSTAGVSDEVAQELQMPIGPQMLDVEEPVPIKS